MTSSNWAKWGGEGALTYKSNGTWQVITQREGGRN